MDTERDFSDDSQNSDTESEDDSDEEYDCTYIIKSNNIIN